jgi:hypothetical protein
MRSQIIVEKQIFIISFRFITRVGELSFVNIQFSMAQTAFNVKYVIVTFFFVMLTLIKQRKSKSLMFFLINNFWAHFKEKSLTKNLFNVKLTLIFK